MQYIYFLKKEVSVLSVKYRKNKSYELLGLFYSMNDFVDRMQQPIGDNLY